MSNNNFYRVGATNRLARNYYRDGFNWKNMKPVRESGGAVLVRAILPSDFTQLVQTDMTNELASCKVWEVLRTTHNVESIERGDHVVILKAGIDQIDPSTPRFGVVDMEDIRLVISTEHPIDTTGSLKPEHEGDDYNEEMDGDHQSALASAGFGTDEDYGSPEDML